MNAIRAGISHTRTLNGDLQFNHKTPTRANKNAELRFSQTPCLHLCRTVLQALLATAAGRRSAHARPWVPAKPIKKHTNAQPSSCCRLLVACCKNPQASRELKRLKLANLGVESPALHATAARTARAAWEATQQLLACRQPLSARTAGIGLT